MTDSSQLLVCPDRLDRLVQLLLRRMQMLFRLRAMPSHIVMVGCAGLVHLMDCLSHVFLDPLQVVPVMNLIGNRDPGSKRQTRRKNRNYNRFRHSFSSQSCGLSVPDTYGYELFSPTTDLLSKGKNYSSNWSSASKAFRSRMITLRPSILTRPSDWKRERFREISSRTVPICDANSWLLTGNVTSTPSAVCLPSVRARRKRKEASRCRTVVKESSSMIPTSRRSRAPTTRSTLSATCGCARQSA